MIIVRIIAMLVGLAILGVFLLGVVITLHEPGRHTIAQWLGGLVLWSPALAVAFLLIFGGVDIRRPILEVSISRRSIRALLLLLLVIVAAGGFYVFWLR